MMTKRVKKPKNLVLDNFGESIFTEKINRILIIKNGQRTDKKFEKRIEDKFQNSEITSANINSLSLKEIERLCKQKFELVIPLQPYKSSLEEKRIIEKFALKLDMKYFVIYENDYGSIRLVTKKDLLYRRHYCKLSNLAYSAFIASFIVVPCYVFYGIYKTILLFRSIFSKRCGDED